MNETPLMVAVRRADLRMVSFLIDETVNPFASELDLKTTNELGKTADQLAEELFVNESESRKTAGQFRSICAQLRRRLGEESGVY